DATGRSLSATTSDAQGSAAGVVTSMFALLGAVLLVYGVAYAVLTFVVFRGYRGDELRRVAADSAAVSASRRVSLYLMGGDEITFPVTTVLAALASVVVLVLAPEFTSDPLLIVGALAGLVGGWLMMVTSFATSYLREWALRGAVEFPEKRPEAGTGREPGRERDRAESAHLRANERRMSDFVYVAVQYATSYASSDFTLVAARVRVLASLNSVLAFLFGTVVIGMFLSFAVSAGFAG
ncbi:MAG: DUF1345 domain-containing protein, partial [Pseudoclavibacter sp.]